MAHNEMFWEMKVFMSAKKSANVRGTLFRPCCFVSPFCRVVLHRFLCLSVSYFRCMNILLSLRVFDSLILRILS